MLNVVLAHKYTEFITTVKSFIEQTYVRMKKLKVAILESFNIKLASFVTKRNGGKVHKRPHLELKIGTKVGVICHCPV